jgi:hypothetical protein
MDPAAAGLLVMVFVCGALAQKAFISFLLNSEKRDRFWYLFFDLVPFLLVFSALSPYLPWVRLTR